MAFVIKRVTMGEGGVKNRSKLRDVIDVRVGRRTNVLVNISNVVQSTQKYIKYIKLKFEDF